MNKVKRECVICGKESMLNRFHGLDSKSIGEALYCKSCRNLSVEEREKIRNLKGASDVNKRMSKIIFGN